MATSGTSGEVRPIYPIQPIPLKDALTVVQNAITAERLVEARKALRREPRGRGEIFSQNKDFKRGTYLSQTCKVEEDTKAGITRNPQFQVTCQFCNKLGHTANHCRNKPNEVNCAQTICQMCNLNGHSAKQCKRMIKCQACGNLGHSARQCQFENSRILLSYLSNVT